MNHNRRKFTPTADMPRPMARTQTRHEFGRGHTVRYVITDMPRLDGTRGDVTVREFKKLRAMAKAARREVRRASNNKETTT